MKCIVIDDEPLAREGMKMNIKDAGGLQCIAEFDNTNEAKAFLENNDVDLMFLDVEMPGESGITFLKSLEKPPLTILATAYTDYALDGYELNVVDYLVKPIRLERFMQAYAKAQKWAKAQEAEGEQQLIENNGNDHIFLKSERKFVKVCLDDILYIKGMKDYVMVYSEDNKIMTAMNIKTIFDQLDQNKFARISKSYIINVAKVSEVMPTAVMIGNEEIPLGKTYKDDFLNNFVRNNLLER